ncbi:hypothetical protein QSJ18_07095 [Gordonia sp. ABSL1-1]|uniref:hypothetical protein n=1 Tax=Gordonia sp. ABSL1-1 TaxID=3053923 RepID=UPI002572224F|nr:hypothetical protein [Gordonia sp. ABSL1-1]MDL9936504.1 hypothetical protein [Gordonia sp. ABSL1-1]
MSTTAAQPLHPRRARGVSRIGRPHHSGQPAIRSGCGYEQFLLPGDREWTDDGASRWIRGNVHGLTYSGSGTGRLTLLNRGDADLGVLSVPRMPDTRGSEFSFIAAGAAVTVPEASYHILQTPRVGGRPVLVGEIRVDDDVHFTVDAPTAGSVDMAGIDPDDDFWKPGDPDFGCADDEQIPDLDFADPHAAGIYHTVADGTATVHNRGDESVGVLTLGVDGPLDLVVIGPGESAPLPPVDLLCYVQRPRAAGRPVIFGALWMRGGRAMPTTLPIPNRREFLDQRYLTPWSADYTGGYTRSDHLDADDAGVSFQYRTGASTLTVRNSGDSWVAVSRSPARDEQRGGHEDGGNLTELPPGTKATFALDATAATGQVFSILGPRTGGSPGRPPYMSASGTIHPGWPGRPGLATRYGSIVVMLGSVVYTAVPKRNLYLAWSDRRRARRGGS